MVALGIIVAIIAKAENDMDSKLSEQMQVIFGYLAVSLNILFVVQLGVLGFWVYFVSERRKVKGRRTAGSTGDISDEGTPATPMNSSSFPSARSEDHSRAGSSSLSNPLVLDAPEATSDSKDIVSYTSSSSNIGLGLSNPLLNRK